MRLAQNLSFDTIKNDITCLWDATTFGSQNKKKVLLTH